MGNVTAGVARDASFGWACWHSDTDLAAGQKTALVSPAARA
jgi:hypothetical protein